MVQGDQAFDVPTSEEFTRTLGRITWLMTQDDMFRSRPVSDLTSLFVTPLMFKQVRVFLKGSAPIAALSWAYASDEVLAKIALKTTQLNAKDWRSGDKIAVVDVISPFVPRDIFTAQFFKSVSTLSPAAH